MDFCRANPPTRAEAASEEGSREGNQPRNTRNRQDDDPYLFSVNSVFSVVVIYAFLNEAEVFVLTVRAAEQDRLTTAEVVFEVDRE